jgi:tetratricopeptide (TPR) repeat protein
MHTTLTALGLDPLADALGLAALGVLAARDEDWQAAALAFEAAAELGADPQHFAAAAFAWQKLGDVNEAAAAYDRALGSGRITDLQAWANAAEAFADAGLHAKALVAMKRVVALDPNGDDPASRRVRLLALKAARELQAGA